MTGAIGPSWPESAWTSHTLVEGAQQQVVLAIGFSLPRRAAAEEEKTGCRAGCCSLILSAFFFFYFSNSFLYQIKRRRVRQACSAQIADVGVFLRGRADWLRAKCGCIRPVESMGTAVSELQTFSLLGVTARREPVPHRMACVQLTCDTQAWIRSEGVALEPGKLCARVFVRAVLCCAVLCSSHQRAGVPDLL